jgi:asparagine synthase (glutamine-hydrolysing)
MCGIAGFVVPNPQSPTAERAALLQRMCRRIIHRGPDDQGFLVEGRAAIGMRRLSIIDVSGGRQPISGCQGKVTIVFNGEIYNYKELQTKLEARGHRFQTHSDTEAIVHAYEEYGAACVEHLRGMFAFALWDSINETLFLARDRVGKKPLYFTLTPMGTLVFGSELKSLLEHPEVNRKIDLEAMDAYMALGYVPDPLCIFNGISKLPPGHHVSFENGHIKVTEYWDFPFTTDEPSSTRSAEDYLEELRFLLDEAVRVRLMSEVPLGAFLSGGVDSSAVVGFMAQHLDQPVKTFSIGFNEDSFNELKYARITAQHFGTDHHEFVVTPDVCHIVDELAWHFDEPFADPSAIPTYMVSKLAREHVTVALSGDGGDELFAGYPRYVIDQQRSIYAHLPRVVRRTLMEPLSQLLPHGAWGRNYLHNVALDPLDRYFDSMSLFTRPNKRALYSTDLCAQLAPKGDVAAATFHLLGGRVRKGSTLDTLLYVDNKTYLPGDILTKVDRMSMAVSLEVRAPLVDHKLIEFVARIPASLKLHGTQTKHIFKRAVRGLVPDEMLNRPKQGFGLPLQQWINQELQDYIRGVMTERRTLERGYFNQDYINLLFAEHSRERRDHGAQLWSLFMLEQWHRTFINSPSDIATPETVTAPAGVG